MLGEEDIDSACAEAGRKTEVTSSTVGWSATLFGIARDLSRDSPVAGRVAATSSLDAMKNLSVCLLSPKIQRRWPRSSRSSRRRLEQGRSRLPLAHSPTDVLHVHQCRQ